MFFPSKTPKKSSASLLKNVLLPIRQRLPWACSVLWGPCCTDMQTADAPQTPPDCGVGYRSTAHAIHARQDAGESNPLSSVIRRVSESLAARLGAEASAATWFNPHPNAEDECRTPRELSARSDRCIPHGCVGPVWSLDEAKRGDSGDPVFAMGVFLGWSIIPIPTPRSRKIPPFDE